MSANAKLKKYLTRVMPNRFWLVAATGLISGLIFGYAEKSKSSSPAIATAAGGLIGIVILVTAWLLTSRFIGRKLNLTAENSRRASSWPFVSFVYLPLQYAPYLVYQSSTSENVLRPLSPAWQGILVFGLSVGLVVSLLSLKFSSPGKGWLETLRRRPRLVLIVATLAWIFAACSLDLLKTYYMNKTGYNTPIFTEGLRNITSDNGTLYSTLLLIDGSSLLGIHTSFIWYLIYPIFRIWPSYQGLLIISDIFLGLAAIPAYLISRRFFSPGVSLLLVAVLLLNRTFFSQPAINDMSEERFLPVLFLSSFYFWQIKRFWPFLIFGILAVTVREDIAISLALMGVIALFYKRSKEWWLIPALIGSIWFVIMIHWVIPNMNPIGDATTRAVVRYSSLGQDSGEILSTLFFRPWVAVGQAFSSVRHLATWYGLWQSFGLGSPLLSITVILALPSLAQTLLLAQPGLNLFNLLILAATIFPALVIGLRRVDSFSIKRWQVSAAATLTLLTLFSNLALSYTWFNPSWYQPRYNYDVANKILDMIPDDATVILPDFMATFSKPTQTVNGYQQVVWEQQLTHRLNVEQDFVVVDNNIPAQWINSRYYAGRNQLSDAVKSSSDFVLSVDQDDLQLYVRRSLLGNAGR